MNQAVKDKLFDEDLKEVSKDFEAVDLETIDLEGW
jgi:hypothetical protein